MEERPLEPEDEINLLDLLIVLCKRKGMIFCITFGFAIVTAIISLLLPPIYRAETKILPPQQSSSSVAQMLGAFAGLASMAGINLGSTSVELYAALLKTNPVLDGIIDEFNLMKVYDVKYREDARKALLSNVNINVDTKSSLITIAVEDKDPHRAANMANAFVKELKKLTEGLAITEAAQRRLFFEEQLKKTKAALTKAEDNLKEFQKKTGAIKVEEQAKAVIEAIANLKAQIVAKEAEIRVMKTYSTSKNPDLQKAEESLNALKEELRKLEKSQGTISYNPLIPTSRLSDVGIEYLRKMREVKYYETLYELLAKQYEVARLEEARQAVVIQVVQKATPPEKKAKPKRALMVLVATFTGVFLSVFAAFLFEFKERMEEDPENKKRLELLRQYMPKIRKSNRQAEG